MAQKVIIIAYYWPPAGGPGVQRWLKFAKYLPDFDIEPIVFVPENPMYPIIDESLVQEVPENITIIKYPIQEPYGLASALSRKQTKTISSGILPKEGKQSLLQKMMLYVRGNFFIPDARVGWVRPAGKFLKRYIAENNIKTIITTGPPHSLHLIGRDLKKNYPDIQWFTDFRDPWTTIGYHDKLQMTEKTKAKHKQLEKEVLNASDHIIVTSPGTQNEFHLLTDRPITVITNGFDGAVAEVSKDVLHNTESFVLGHFGSLLSDRNPEILWEVLSELKDEIPTFSKALKLRFAGKISQEILNSLEEHNLNDNFIFLGYLPHSEIDIELSKVDVLLLIEIDALITRAIIPGKVFEYLASRKPIIAIGPEQGDVSVILEETKAGVYFSYNDKKALKSTLLSLYNGSKKINSDKEAIMQYHRKVLTSHLATLIKENT